MPSRKAKIGKRKRVPKVLVRKNNVVVKNPTSKSAWRSISGYEGLYEVSSNGKVRSLEREVITSDGKLKVFRSQVLRSSKDKDGYLLVHLYKDGKSSTRRVHLLVATAFIPNPNGFTEVNHLNEVKDDNRVENLEWCTRKENMNYGSRSEKASESITKYLYQRFTLKGEYIDTLSYKEIVELGFDYGFVVKASIGEYRTAYGLIWKRILCSEYKKNITPILRKNGVVENKPTSDTCWKSFERVVANYFGTRRVPLSGSNSGHGTNSDSLHPKLYIECKVRSKIALWQLFVDTEKKAKIEGKVPVVAIKQKGEKGYLLVMRPEDLEKINEIRSENSSI